MRQSQVSDKANVQRLTEVEGTAAIICRESPDQKKVRPRSSTNRKSSIGGKVPAMIKQMWKPEFFFADFKDSAEGISLLAFIVK